MIAKMDLLNLTDTESSLVRSLVDQSTTVEVVENKTIDPDVVWSQLTICLKAHKKADDVSLKLRPIIGKFLILAKKNPDCYLKHGYTTYESFIQNYVKGKMGLSRAALYAARMVAERLPDLTPEDYVEVGPTNANLLASFCSSSDSKYPEYLEEAKSKNTIDFKSWADEQKLISAGDHESVIVSIQTNKTTADMWRDLKSQPSVHNRVGSSFDGDIFKAMIEEVCVEWLAHVEV